MNDAQEPVWVLNRAGENSLSTEHVRRQAALAAKVIGLAGISTVGVWEQEDPLVVWASDPRLRARGVVWAVGRPVLEAAGFEVVKTGEDPRHFTVVLPDLEEASIVLLRSLMQRWER